MSSQAPPATAATTATALVVDRLHVTYKVRATDRLAVRDVSFSIGREQTFGLVGESGCGKSTTALAITRYLPSNGRISGGSISVNGQDLASMGPDALRRLRARTISMVYQEPARALNPSIRVGRQVAEVYELAGLKKAEALERAEEMLRVVQIPRSSSSTSRRQPSTPPSKPKYSTCSHRCARGSTRQSCSSATTSA